MDAILTALRTPEVAPTWLQLAASVGLVVLCVRLDRRYRRRYFLLWAVAWSCYAMSAAGVLGIAVTNARAALFWQQVLFAWAVSAIAWASVVFAQGRPNPAWVFLAAFLPVVWNFVAVYLLAGTLWAGIPLVAYAAAMLLIAAGALLRYDQMVRSPAGRYLAVVFLLWAIVQASAIGPASLRLPLPWSAHVVTMLVVAAGAGILLLVLEDLSQGLDTLTALSGELHGGFGGEEVRLEAMLRRALSLRGVHGSALWLLSDDAGAFVQGAGVAALWPFETPPGGVLAAVRRVGRDGVPQVVQGGEGAPSAGPHPYTAALPVRSDDEVLGAVVVVGEARDPFTVLDDRFLVAFGEQVGAALANEELHHDLTARTAELERLQARLVHQHEEERNRIWRALHDETAQVLAALNLQLGVLKERMGPDNQPALDRARTLLGDGIQSIRRVTRDLRPLPLDDLGLLAALSALARDFDSEAVRVRLDADEHPPDLEPDAESALYRAMQEGLSNALRHGARSQVKVRLTSDTDRAVLVVEDDGPGIDGDVMDRVRSSGGLAGIRERVGALGGEFTVGNSGDGGAQLTVAVPLRTSVQGEGL